MCQCGLYSSGFGWGLAADCCNPQMSKKGGEMFSFSNRQVLVNNSAPLEELLELMSVILWSGRVMFCHTFLCTGLLSVPVCSLYRCCDGCAYGERTQKCFTVLLIESLQPDPLYVRCYHRVAFFISSKNCVTVTFPIFTKANTFRLVRSKLHLPTRDFKPRK